MIVGIAYTIFVKAMYRAQLAAYQQELAQREASRAQAAAGDIEAPPVDTDGEGPAEDLAPPVAPPAEAVRV